MFVMYMCNIFLTNTTWY